MSFLAVAVCLGVMVAPPVRADGLVDLSADSSADSLLTFFPNWKMAKAADFTIEVCDDLACAPDTNCPITGLTIWNYGTASGGPASDITAVYFNLVCGTTNGWATLTYAGAWEDSSAISRPAWTWSGSIPWAADPNNAKGGCTGYPDLHVYADIGPCPTDGATVKLGIGFDDILDPASPGAAMRGTAAPAAVVNPAGHPPASVLRMTIAVVAPGVAASTNVTDT